MAQLLSIVREFNNSELITFLSNNGYGEFEDILKTKEINGEQFVELTEFELVKWKYSGKKKLWSCIAELKQNPTKFLGQSTIGTRQTAARSSILLNKYNIKQKLELVIASKPPDKIVSMRTPPKPQEPLSEYLSMEKTILRQSESHYDESGYLVPNSQREMEENEYEVSPTTPKTMDFTNFPSICDRKPMTLPREEHDYIAGPDRLHSPPPPILPRLQPPPSRSVLNTIRLGGSLFSKNNEKAQEEDDRASYEAIDGGPALQPPTETGLRFPENDAKGNVSPHAKSKHHDVSSLFKDRPLPPVPDRMKLDNPSKHKAQKDEYDHDNLLQEYQNIDATVSDMQQNLNSLRLPERLQYPESYEHFLIRHKNQQLPLPPQTFPKEPLFLNAACETTPTTRGFPANLNDEPFYRNTDRKGARLLLQNLGDGAFLFRPSKKFFLTLTWKDNIAELHLRTILPQDRF